MQKFIKQNVLEATNERIKYIFDEFDNISISFSGGKDSGVLLNLTLKYASETGQLHKVSVFVTNHPLKHQKEF